MSLLNKNNLEVCKIASKSDTRPELAGVYITDKLVCATDSFRLLEMTLPADVKAEDYPKIEGKTAMRGYKPFLVNAKYLLKNIKLGVNKNMPILDNLAISHIDENKVEVLVGKDTDQHLLCEPRWLPRITSEQFPDYAKIFPAGNPVAEVEVNAEYLAEILEVMGKLDSLKSVRIKFYGDNQPLALEAKGNNQEARGLLMPLRK